MATDDLAGVISDAHRNLTLYEADIARREKYYNGVRRLASLGMSIPPELEHLHTVVNWPRLAVDSIDERLVLQGMRVGGNSTLDTRATDWMDSNNLAVLASSGHVEALIQGLSYISVDWDGVAGHDPTILPEPANNFWVTWDAKYREILSAVRFWNDPTLTPQETLHLLDPKPTMCTVYEPNVNTYFTLEQGRWVQIDQVAHNTGVVSVVPMVNKQRLNRVRGDSEMTDIIPITDAATRALTDLQAAQELFAMPKYWILGADPASFKAADGTPVPAWEMYLNAVNVLGGEGVSLQQTQSGQLSNYSNVISTYSKLASSVSGIPAYYFGDSGDSNPTSEGSIRASENRLVLKAERRQGTFGKAWADAFRIASMMVDGKPTKYSPVWQDASTPTFAAKGIAVARMFQFGLLSRRAALEELDYQPDQIKAILADFAQSSAIDGVLQQLGVTGSGPNAPAVGGSGTQAEQVPPPPLQPGID
jgi:hypothetical protein